MAPHPVSTWLQLILSAVAVLLLPSLAILMRGVVRLSRNEQKLDTLIKSVEKLVIDKDKTHQAMLEQMREDRSATNRRLEYLERIWISRGMERR